MKTAKRSKTKWGGKNSPISRVSEFKCQGKRTVWVKYETLNCTSYSILSCSEGIREEEVQRHQENHTRICTRAPNRLSACEGRGFLLRQLSLDNQDKEREDVSQEHLRAWQDTWFHSTAPSPHGWGWRREGTGERERNFRSSRTTTAVFETQGTVSSLANS